MKGFEGIVKYESYLLRDQRSYVVYSILMEIGFGRTVRLPMEKVIRYVSLIEHGIPKNYDSCFECVHTCIAVSFSGGTGMIGGLRARHEVVTNTRLMV